MNATYVYSVLTYHHNHASNEVVNVGVLALFPLGGEVYLLRPERAALKRRLQHLYADAACDTVWAYLTSFDHQAKRISGKIGGYLGQYSSLISEQFLTENGSSLRFAEPEISPIWKGTEESLALLQDRFLSGYGAVPSERGVVYSEAYITRKVKDLISSAFSKKKGKTLELYLSEERREVKAGAARIVAPQQWKNGTLNLIHPLALDVKTSDTINERCLSLAKSAELLSDKAEAENISFHFVLSKPQKEGLHDAYEESVAVLEQVNRKIVKVIRPEGWEGYAKDVAAKAVVLNKI